MTQSPNICLTLGLLCVLSACGASGDGNGSTTSTTTGGRGSSGTATGQTTGTGSTTGTVSTTGTGTAGSTGSTSTTVSTGTTTGGSTGTNTTTGGSTGPNTTTGGTSTTTGGATGGGSATNPNVTIFNDSALCDVVVNVDGDVSSASDATITFSASPNTNVSLSGVSMANIGGKWFGTDSSDSDGNASYTVSGDTDQRIEVNCNPQEQVMVVNPNRGCGYGYTVMHAIFTESTGSAGPSPASQTLSMQANDLVAFSASPVDAWDYGAAQWTGVDGTGAGDANYLVTNAPNQTLTVTCPFRDPDEAIQFTNQNCNVTVTAVNNTQLAAFSGSSYSLQAKSNVALQLHAVSSDTSLYQDGVWSGGQGALTGESIDANYTVAVAQTQYIAVGCHLKGGVPVTINNSGGACTVTVSFNGNVVTSFSAASNTVSVPAGITLDLSAPQQPGLQSGHWSGTTTTDDPNATYLVPSTSSTLSVECDPCLPVGPCQ